MMLMMLAMTLLIRNEGRGCGEKKDKENGKKGLHCKDYWPSVSVCPVSEYPKDLAGDG